jgi:hypothetical protein
MLALYISKSGAINFLVASTQSLNVAYGICLENLNKNNLRRHSWGVKMVEAPGELQIIVFYVDSLYVAVYLGETFLVLDFMNWMM